MYNSTMSRLDLTFLGGFAVLLDHQPVTRFRSVNNQGLLVYLVLNGGRLVSREFLATLFWPEETAENARNNLRQALFQLRQTLGDATSGDEAFLHVDRQHARFNFQSDHTLDVSQFMKAIESRDLDRAAALYRSDLLTGFTCDSQEFEDWLRLQREKVHEVALEVMFEAAQDHLAANRLDKTQALARRQLELEPWREPAHRQLMQAYALSGDRGKALAQFEQCRRTLWEELGVKPAPETAALLEEIKSGRYGRRLTEEFIRPPERRRHNLSADTTAFIGRDIELAQIVRLLTVDRQRLVTIIGPGGMGKTRLALAAGAALLALFEDGVFFVDLTPVERPEDIPQTIATSIDYQPADTSQSLRPQLLSSLSRRRLLLILDNFEQVLGGAALVNAILETCPQVSILVTSRERLHLAGENRYELSGLNFPVGLSADDALAYAAVQLFVENARRAQPGFKLTTNNVSDVTRICRQVQGMPLALVLAAAWLELLSPAEIAAEIERGLDFLAAELADLPERQRSMEAVFERSWRMMSPQEQIVMARLSVFRDGFTREAAEEVAGANLRLLLQLVHKSLLQRRADTGRFTIHELLRQYAAARRRAMDPGGEVDLTHCRVFARLVQAEIQRTLNIHPVYVPDRLVTDSENIRRAWDYAVREGLADELFQLAGGIYSLSFAMGIHPRNLLKEGQLVLLAKGMRETDLHLLRLRQIELRSRFGYEEVSKIKNLFLEFVSLAGENGDYVSLYWLYDLLAHIFNQERSLESLGWVARSSEVAKALGNEYYIRRAEATDLWLRVDLGLREEHMRVRLEALLDFFIEELPLADINFSLFWALSTQSMLEGAHDKAVAYGMRGLNLAKSWHNLYAVGQATTLLARIRIMMVSPADAKVHLLDNLEWHLAIGQEWQTIGALMDMLIVFTKLCGGSASVVPILSMIHHHPEVAPFYQEMIVAARPRFETEIGAEAFTAGWTGTDIGLRHGRGACPVSAI